MNWEASYLHSSFARHGTVCIFLLGCEPCFANAYHDFTMSPSCSPWSQTAESMMAISSVFCQKDPKGSKRPIIGSSLCQIASPADTHQVPVTIFILFGQCSGTAWRSKPRQKGPGTPRCTGPGNGVRCIPENVIGPDQNPNLLYNLGTPPCQRNLLGTW